MNLFHGSVLELLEFLGEFSSHDYLMVGSEVFLHITKRSEDAVNRFVYDHSIILVLEGFKEGFSTFFYRKEPEKPEVVHMHSRSDECGENRRSSGNRNYGDILFYRSLHEDIGRIRDSRSSGIGYESNILPFLKECYDFLYFNISGMGMKRDERFMNLIVIEEDSRSSSVLAGNYIRLTKSAKCSESNILEVSDRCRDDIKHEMGYGELKMKIEEIIVLHRISG